MEGLERIKILSQEIKDKPLLKIIDYLLSRTDMNEKYMNEEKSLKQMIEFIKSKAKEKATNGVAVIEDEVVYGWAIHYFDEKNEDLNLSKNNSNTEKVVENNASITNSKIKKKKDYVPEGQLCLFDF